MISEFLGRIAFRDALRAQDEAFSAVVKNPDSGIIIGFECEPVITLGKRAETAQDLAQDSLRLAQQGFSVERVDRGGQATIHNPGQLVIFPIYSVRALGVRAWVKSLAEISQACLREWKIDSQWNEKCPGLYTERGKIMACGVRVRQGVSTHGVALNVSNNLADFALIRACGVENARMDRMDNGATPADVFSVWMDKFRSKHR